VSAYFLFPAALRERIVYRRQSSKEVLLIFWYKWYLEIKKNLPVEANKLSLWLVSLAYYLTWKETEIDNHSKSTEITPEIAVKQVTQFHQNFTQNLWHFSRDWQPGYELKNGKYIIEKELGRGGFGITYLATNNQGELVVIKILKDELLKREDFRQLEEDFVNEAVKLSQFEHPNIVPIVEVIYEGGWCIVMEYIKGKTLEAFVQERNDYLSPSEALLYIKQIGEALKAVHTQGLLHRDVKPQNILIQENTSIAVLIDFGLALKFNRNSVVNSGGLSHGYASLEQYQFNVIWDYYTDVYALAATFYFILTKTKPISAKERASGKKLIPAKDINPKICQHLNEAIDRGMSLDPSSRPGTVEQWLDLLQRREDTNRLNWKPWLILLLVSLGLVVAHSLREVIIANFDPWELEIGKNIQRKCTEIDLHSLTKKCQKNYFFTGTKGEIITIKMNSNQIDPLLILMDAGGNEIAKNDDIDVNNFNAKITKELPKDGRYRVSAQSSQEQELGAFTLSITKN